MKRSARACLLILAIALAKASGSSAAELEVWAALAVATVLAVTGHQFERSTGHTLKISTGLASDFARQAVAGQSFDVIISGSPAIDALIRDGKIVAASRSNIVRSGIGVEVRAGAHKPDIGTVEAFKRALLDAKSIAYLKVGSGAYLHELVGPLPSEIQSYVTFAAGVSASSKAPQAANQLIDFLKGPAVVPVIKAQGMEPAP